MAGMGAGEEGDALPVGALERLVGSGRAKLLVGQCVDVGSKTCRRGRVYAGNMVVDAGLEDRESGSGTVG